MKFNNNSILQKNINNNEQKIDQQLLTIINFNLHPPPAGCFYEKPKINPNLNFTSLEPILLKGKKILIGDGSFSKVFLYQHKNSKIKYAIKKMNILSFIKKTNNKNLILDEINIQSKIFHPNIIRLYNYFRDKNKTNIFLILEYASKGTLFDYIRHNGGLDESESFYYFIQAVNAIYFLHKNKIIHRDLKPENLLINHNNILKLCDFGWSVYLHNNKRVTFCGTVEYMAPEIVKNEGYDFSIDVWSLGVLLYELIHSHSPFVVKDLNINKIEKNILSKELRFKKGVSLECRDLIEKLLIKDAENRIKIGEIYKHPFVLKYINMIENYIKIPKMIYKQNSNNNNVLKNATKKEKEKESKKISKIFNEIRESFSEFDTIPNEPEPSKILVNFDKIARKFTKMDLDNNINQLEEKNKLLKVKSIKNLIDKKLTNETKHSKSISLNNSFFEKLGINNLAKNYNNENNENKYQIMLKQNSKKKENKNLNLNKENLLKLIIKKTKYDSPNIKENKFIKSTLIEDYNKNLNKKKYMNSSKIINKSKESKSKLDKNSFYLKNLLISSYATKDYKNYFNKKFDLSDKNINNKQKLNISSKFDLKNCNSVSYFNNNNSFNNYSACSNSNSSRNIISKKNNNFFPKKNKLIKQIYTSNKNIKKNDLSFNDLKKPHLNNNYRNKITLNLSNINVYNFCSSKIRLDNSRPFNDPKYFNNHLNTFIIMDKSRESKLNQSRKNNLYENIPQTARLENKKTSKIFCETDRSDYTNNNNSNSNRTDFPKKINIKKNQKLYLNFSKINKYKEKGMNLSRKKIKLKTDNGNNIIPSLCIYSK